MNAQDAWEKALKQTEIIRPRVLPLKTFEQTKVPYIFLASSNVNSGDTVVRKGEVIIERPLIALPMNMPQFEGFEFSEGMDLNADLMRSFFLVRGVQFPSFKYNNTTSSLEVFEGRLPDAIEHHMRVLSQDENVHAGLLSGPEEVWQFSLIIFVCSQIGRSAEHDIKKLTDFGHFGSLS